MDLKGERGWIGFRDIEAETDRGREEREKEIGREREEEEEEEELVLLSLLFQWLSQLCSFNKVDNIGQWFLQRVGE